MSIERVSRPYEFLVRWGPGGVIQGAHIQFIEEVKDGGEVIAATLGNAHVVALAGESGFPLADVLSSLHVAALRAVDDANATASAAQVKSLDDEARRVAAERRAETLAADLASANEQLAQLRAK